MAITLEPQRRSAPAAPPPDVSVVIPCLNEGRTIARVVSQVRDALAALGVVGEVVVADNGSSDGSPAASAAAGARVVHVMDRGYGNALNGGIRAALGGVIIILDGDGTYDPRDIPLLVSQLCRGYDIVIGSRYLGERVKGSMPLRSRIGNPLLTWLLNLLYGTRLSDTHSGMRAFTKEAWERLALVSGGMTWTPEMCIKAAALGLKVTEVPIRYLPAPEGRRSHQRTLRDGWHHLRFLLAYRPEVYLLAPGLVAILVGPALMLGQAAFQLPVIGHLGMVAAGATMVSMGHFALASFLISRVFLSAIGLRQWGRTMDKALRALTAERAIALVVTALVLAVAMATGAFLRWLQGHGGPLEMGVMGIAVSVGVASLQTFLSVFLCSLIGEEAPMARDGGGCGPGMDRHRRGHIAPSANSGTFRAKLPE